MAKIKIIGKDFSLVFVHAKINYFTWKKITSCLAVNLRHLHCFCGILSLLCSSLGMFPLSILFPRLVLICFGVFCLNQAEFIWSFASCGFTNYCHKYKVYKQSGSSYLNYETFITFCKIPWLATLSLTGLRKSALV